MSIKDKVVIVTGGTSGIGLATCKELASKGAIVYACARHEKTLDSAIRFHELDVTSIESCKALVRDVMEAEGRIDVLVANAGITSDALTVKMSEQQFDDVVNTNLKGIFNIVKEVGPLMEKSGGGSVVTVSSIVGEYGNIGQANYAASKAGIIGMSKSWAKEFARKGVPVRVNTVAPGFIATGMLDTVPEDLLTKLEQSTMLKRLGKPEEVAQAIAFLASDESSYITGTVLDVNGGMRL